MHVEIILTVKEMRDQLLSGKTAVVIDTLRATSTIVTALANGAVGIEPLPEIDDARRRGKELAFGTYLLCGEREGQKIEGFDLGNSPLEYQPEIVQQKKVILSTTNGTLTIARASTAKRILIVSLLNKSSTMDEVIEVGDDLVLCCAGTKGHFSLEDFVTAGAMISDLKEKGISVIGDDKIQAACSLYEHNQNDLVELFSCSQNGLRLLAIDRLPDIQFCSQENIFPLVCRYTEGIIKT